MGPSSSQCYTLIPAEPPMTMQSDPQFKSSRRYVRAPVPVHFPVEADVPETKRHLRLRTALFQSLQRAFADGAWIGSDQFVYWDPTDARRCVAPDVMVKRGGPDDDFQVWKTWERGAPELAVEIVSDSDRPDDDSDHKRAKYDRMGVRELVRFDADAQERRLRIWDRVDGDFVERLLDTPAATQSDVVDGYWIVTDDAEYGPILRLARDEHGTDLYPTPDERGDALAAKLRELGVDPDTC